MKNGQWLVQKDRKFLIKKGHWRQLAQMEYEANEKRCAEFKIGDKIKILKKNLDYKKHLKRNDICHILRIINKYSCIIGHKNCKQCIDREIYVGFQDIERIEE